MIRDVFDSSALPLLRGGFRCGMLGAGSNSIIHSRENPMKKAILIVSLTACVAAIGCMSVHPYARQGGLQDLALVTGAQSARVSSAGRVPDIDSNKDNIPIKPGQTVELANIEGPGIITHIWCTIRADDPFYPRSLVLRMYWDGDEDPAVEAPIGDFFGVGHGEDRELNSEPVQIASRGRGRNCFWHMPYRKSARITLTNDSPIHPVTLFYYYIDYDRVPKLPKNTAYFHAQYRQEHPCGEGDYLILDTEGAGQYVGTVMSVWNARGGWWGEGDDRFYVDGDETPTLHGTGTEDYFGDAWGYREFNHPYHGVSLLDTQTFYPGDRTTTYRWHIKDPVRFTKSLRFEFEHKGNMMGYDMVRIPYSEHECYYSSVAFWYQTGKARRFASIPPVEERMPINTCLDARKLADKKRLRVSDTAELHKDSPREVTHGKPMAWLVPNPGEKSTWFEVDLPVPETKTYNIRLSLSKGPGNGSVKVLLEGQILKEIVSGREIISLEANALAFTPVRFDWRLIEKGEHTLRVEYDSQKGKSLGIDSVSLIPQMGSPK